MKTFVMKEPTGETVLGLLAQWDRQFESRLEFHVFVALRAVLCLNVVCYFV
jgi:hypothetical protein